MSSLNLFGGVPYGAKSPAAQKLRRQARKLSQGDWDGLRAIARSAQSLPHGDLLAVMQTVAWMTNLWWDFTRAYPIVGYMSGQGSVNRLGPVYGG